MQLQFNKVFLLPTEHRTMIVTNQSCVICRNVHISYIIVGTDLLMYG